MIIDRLANHNGKYYNCYNDDDNNNGIIIQKPEQEIIGQQRKFHA